MLNFFFAPMLMNIFLLKNKKDSINSFLTSHEFNGYILDVQKLMNLFIRMKETNMFAEKHKHA